MNFMEFDKSRLYSATNADELKEGSKVIPADNLIQLERRIKKGNCTIYILERIHSSGFLTHCFICRNSRNNRVSVFNLVYLVSPPDDAGTAGKPHFCNEEKDSANPVFFAEEDHLMVTSDGRNRFCFDKDEDCVVWYWTETLDDEESSAAFFCLADYSGNARFGKASLADFYVRPRFIILKPQSQNLIIKVA